MQLPEVSSVSMPLVVAGVTPSAPAELPMSLSYKQHTRMKVMSVKVGLLASAIYKSDLLYPSQVSAPSELSF